MSDIEPHRGGLYQPIGPAFIGLIVGLITGIIFEDFARNQIMNIYHTAGNPIVIIELVNNGLAPVLSISMAIMVGLLLGLIVFTLVYNWGKI